MVSTCFLTPSLPCKFQPNLHSANVTTHVTRVQPTASLRFPNGNRNPFGSASGSASNFFKFGSRASFTSFGTGSGFGKNNGGGFGRGGRGRGDGGNSGGGGGGDSDNIFLKIWAMYCSQLDRSPITTKAFTSLIGFFLGDLIAQKFMGDKDADIDWARVARMASFGFLLHGPTGHYFYSALDRSVVGTTPIKVATKVAIDQILWAPVFTSMFFAYLGFSEGKSLDDVINKIKNDTWTGVTASWKFWPLAHAINFAFVPTAQRILYINTLQVGFNVILSMIGNK